MPRLSAYAAHAALIHLLTGFTFGGLMLADKGIPIHPSLVRLLPAHIDLLLFGWTAQLAMAVAYWILPRHSQAPKRGNERIAQISFIALNLGVLLVGFSPWAGLAEVLHFAGRTMQFLGIAAFIYIALPRVKPSGSTG